MSLARPILNAWLKWTEKPFLRRAQPVSARKTMEAKAKIYFHAPRGASFAEGRLDAVPVHWAWGLGVGREDGPLLLYFHGGAFVFGSPMTHRAMLARLSSEAGVPAALVQYPLAPESPFPAAADTAMDAYRAVMQRPGGVVLGGDSAGGALALGLLARILDEGLPRPLGCFAMSPLTDLTFSGDSITRNAQSDAMLPIERAEELTGMYLNGVAPEDPRVSPLFADFNGAPPVWICAGDTEALLDDTTRMAARLRDQGVEVTEVIERDLPHVWPLFHNLLPEARATLEDLGGWIRRLSRGSDES